MSKDMRELLAGYVDGELSAEERKAFEAELERDPELRAELDEFRKLKEVTSMVKYADLPLEVWDNYWQNLYRKLERGFGWILFSIGAIVLLSFAVFELFKGLYNNPEVPMLIKVGVTAVAIGAVVLGVSFIRETLFAYKRDRYKEVIR
ncbi:MAG TPA: zf-HC2 domain-containing protein [candidate division Zixibacteria bacterium]|nr:zf-HC2 domain-containing protein [candidate division Zixibacteria bacterium]